MIKHQVPLVASSNNLRKFTTNEIKQYYPNAKYIVELGSGFGGMTRYIARHTNANTTGIENIHWNVFISKILDTFCKYDTKTILSDAFEYLDNTEKHFDVAVAYLGPVATQKISEYKNKIDVFISLCFPINDIKPTRIINVDNGSTIIGGKKYPHKLYIYEFRKK